MTPSDMQPQPNEPHWKRAAARGMRELGNAIYRRRIVLLSMTIPLLIATVMAGVLFHRSAQAMERQLRVGVFRDSVNIYAGEMAFNEGDGLSVEDLGAELRLAGYVESSSGELRTFAMTGGALDIVPSKAGQKVHIKVGSAGLQIADGDRPVKVWSAGFPLIANLSAGKEKRHLVTFREIPTVLVNAVVSAEDKHFFQHNGLDIPRIAKAAYVDLVDGRKEQGASTLTMQLVRGLWLQPEKLWSRKLSEMAMTIHLERKWSKQEIFETYANQVFLGREAAYSIQGFAEGSEQFFGKSLRNITLPEAALLAGMVQRPSFFNPYRNPDRAKERRNLVLGLMKNNGYIDTEQYRAAVDVPITVTTQREHNDAFRAPYFLDLVNDELQKAGQADAQVKNVYTTIDLNLQRAASEAIDAGMAGVDKMLAKRMDKSGVRAEAALIAIDPRTGAVKALIGGRDYAKSQFNRVLAKRPPGSVFKPFVYAAALNTAVNGGDPLITAATEVTDDATTFANEGGKDYQPSNFHHEAFGTLTLREALAKSDNVAAVKVAQMVGYREVVAMAQRAGLNDEIRPTPSVALGSYVVTPLEMAGAYTVFANGGMWMKPRMIESVSAGEGKRAVASEEHQALDPRVTYLMVSMLQEVMRSGTAAGARSKGFVLPAAGKTGTSHDGWFAGFTSELLCLVWVGYDDYRVLKLEGAKSALPIWTEFMKKASKLGAYRNASAFTAPPGISSATICSISGKLAGDLCFDTRSEVFVSGTEPQEKCDIHAISPGAAPVISPVAAVSGNEVIPPGF